MPSPVELQTRERLTLNLRPLGIAEIPVIGRYNYSHAHLGLERHAHPGAMEICFLAKGTQLYRLGRRDYLLRGGDLFVTFPDEQHSTGEAPEEKGVLYWVQIILPRRFSRFLNCSPADSRTLVSQLLHIKDRHFHGGLPCQTLLEEIILAATAGDNPLKKIALSTKLIEFLLKVIECSGHHPNSSVSPAMNGLLRAIEASVEQPLSLKDMAALMELSVSRLKARFKQEIGIPPAEYVQRCKIAAAKKLLAGGNATITDIAFRLNFSSSQYFATVFKRYTGQAPRVYLSSTRAPCRARLEPKP